MAQKDLDRDELRADLKRLGRSFGEFAKAFIDVAAKYVEHAIETLAESLEEEAEPEESAGPAAEASAPTVVIKQRRSKATGKRGRAKKPAPSVGPDRKKQLLEAVVADPGRTLGEVGRELEVRPVALSAASRSLQRQGVLREEDGKLWPAAAEVEAAPRKSRARGKARRGGGQQGKRSPKSKKPARRRADRKEQVLVALAGADGRTLVEIGAALGERTSAFVQAAIALEKEGKVRREGAKLFLVPVEGGAGE